MIRLYLFGVIFFSGPKVRWLYGMMEDAKIPKFQNKPLPKIPEMYSKWKIDGTNVYILVYFRTLY